MTPEFTAFPKLARLNRDIYVTEKLDGTNAAIGVLEDGTVYAQSRKRLIAPGDDNFGFAGWVAEHADELREQLGVGLHYGEWWGLGIQRGYGLDHKRFSLFNTGRWTSDSENDYRCVEAPLCHVVPILDVHGAFDSEVISDAMDELRARGSFASHGFKPAEGVVVYHSAANALFKATLEADDKPKSLA